MKIILTQEVSGLGGPGDIVEVKDGFGRNYLLPQGFAIRWTKGAEKQVAVIKRMVRDLDLELEIRVVSTVREEDGLALSSRNVLLSPEDRARGLTLPHALQAGAAADDPVATALAALDGLEVDYFEEADFEPRVLAAAVRVGKTRLIDNVVLEEGAPT